MGPRNEPCRSWRGAMNRLVPSVTLMRCSGPESARQSVASADDDDVEVDLATRQLSDLFKERFSGRK